MAQPILLFDSVALRSMIDDKTLATRFATGRFVGRSRLSLR